MSDSPIHRLATRPGVRLVFEIAGVTQEDVKRGIYAAFALFKLEGLSVLAAYDAIQVTGRKTNFSMETEKHTFNLWAEFCDRADIWTDAEEIALSSACRDLPAGKYEYQFRVEWTDEGEGAKHGSWQTFEKK